MHVMVVTRRTQGQRDSDYMWAVPGELAFLPVVECDWGTPASFRRGARYFLGLESGGATTTAEIVDMDVASHDVAAYVEDKLATAGWTVSARTREALRLVTEMLSIAACFPAGAVVEKSGRDIRQRRGDEVDDEAPGPSLTPQPVGAPEQLPNVEDP
jgi:hypothetical protein